MPFQKMCKQFLNLEYSKKSYPFAYTEAKISMALFMRYQMMVAQVARPQHGLLAAQHSHNACDSDPTNCGATEQESSKQSHESSEAAQDKGQVTGHELKVLIRQFTSQCLLELQQELAQNLHKALQPTIAEGGTASVKEQQLRQQKTCE